MSTKTVDVLYNGKETLMDIEINEDNLYNSFLDIFRQKFNENDPLRHKFKLTTINTSIPYLLLDENNIASIIKEKIENNAPLKLLLTKEEEDYEELKRDSVNDKYLSGFVKEAPIDVNIQRSSSLPVTPSVIAAASPSMAYWRSVLQMMPR